MPADAPPPPVLPLSASNSHLPSPKRRPSKRRTIVGAVVLLAIASAGVAFGVVGLPLMRISTAYAAKALCSEIFVAGRRPNDAIADLAIDDLGALRLLTASVDTAGRTTRARFIIFGERRALYRDGVGCVLESSGQTSAVASLAPELGRPTAAAHDGVAVQTPNVRRALDRVLDAAFAEPDSTHPRRTRAVVVLRRGAVVAERYAAGIGVETPLPGWSMTKSVLNALVGVAVKEGNVRVEDPVRLAAWSAVGDPRAKITINDLMHMSSGLAFNEAQAGLSSDVLQMLFREPDMVAFAAHKPVEVTPGSRWRYSSGAVMILNRVLRDALGEETYRRFPRVALFEPLGMIHAVIETDARGNFVASSYMYATAREWARFGQLYLQDGVWMGQRILPDGWVTYTRTPAPAAPSSTYGALFWLSTPAEYRGPPAVVPADAFHAVGHEGQFVTIIPSEDVVIVRLGRTRYASAWEHDRFVASVLTALHS